MKNKTYIILDWVYLTLSYLSVLAVTLSFNPVTSEAIFGINSTAPGKVFNAGFILAIILFLLQIPLYISTCINARETERSLTMHNMIIKIVAIPYFIINIYFCYLGTMYSLGLSVFLAPLAIVSLSLNTYLVMFRPSLHNLIYVYKRIRSKNLNITPSVIIGVIFSFIYVLDSISGIIIFTIERHQNPEKIEKRRLKRRTNVLKRIEAWNNKKHSNSVIFMIISFALAIVLFIPTISIFITVGSEFLNLVSESKEFGDLFIEGSFTNNLIMVGIIILLNFILGIIHGKNRENNPVIISLILKILYAIPIILLFISAGIFFLVSSVFGAFGVIFIPLIPVIIFALMAFILIGMGLISGLFGAGLLIFAILGSLGSSLITFSYYMNQRVVKNRKFSNNIVVVCMVLLWIPFANVIALIAIKIIDLKSGIFGDVPLIELNIE